MASSSDVARGSKMIGGERRCDAECIRESVSSEINLQMQNTILKIIKHDAKQLKKKNVQGNIFFFFVAYF